MEQSESTDVSEEPKFSDISEDSVTSTDMIIYSVYPTNLPMSQQELTSLQEGILTVTNPFSNQFNWDLDEFRLGLSYDKTHLTGQVTHRQNAEDAWFVVGLLKHVTQQFLDVVIRVIEGEGEILMAEIADILPTWVRELEDKERRIYLFRGQVHLIPLPNAETFPIPSGDLTVNCAVRSIAKYSDVTLADANIQECIEDRLGNYPFTWKDHKFYNFTAESDSEEQMNAQSESDSSDTYNAVEEGNDEP